MIRDQIKKTCVIENLPAEHFRVTRYGRLPPHTCVRWERQKRT